MKNSINVVYMSDDHKTRIVRYCDMYYVEVIFKDYSGAKKWYSVYATPDYRKALYKALS